MAIGWVRDRLVLINIAKINSFSVSQSAALSVAQPEEAMFSLEKRATELKASLAVYTCGLTNFYSDAKNIVICFHCCFDRLR